MTNQIADSGHRSKSFHSGEVVRACAENTEWQIAEVQSALDEANVGEFAADEEIAAFYKK